MRDYEIVYIFRAGLASHEIEAKLERYHAIIAADGQGEVPASVHWGKRQLAYPIRKERNGYYAVAQFTSVPDPLTELERVLRLDDELLRYLIVIAEHPLPLPAAAPSADAVPSADAPEADAEPGAGEVAAAGAGDEAAADADEGAGEEAGGADDSSEASSDGEGSDAEEPAAEDPAPEEAEESAADESAEEREE